MDLRGARRGVDLQTWAQSRSSLRPLYVADHLQQGYVHAEREALKKLKGAGYALDDLAICP
jgi:hypothetical protein